MQPRLPMQNYLREIGSYALRRRLTIDLSSFQAVFSLLPIPKASNHENKEQRSFAGIQETIGHSRSAVVHVRREQKAPDGAYECDSARNEQHEPLVRPPIIHRSLPIDLRRWGFVHARRLPGPARQRKRLGWRRTCARSAVMR